MPHTAKYRIIYVACVGLVVYVCGVLFMGVVFPPSSCSCEVVCRVLVESHIVPSVMFVCLVNVVLMM